jgi:hypothetical protein
VLRTVLRCLGAVALAALAACSAGSGAGAGAGGPQPEAEIRSSYRIYATAVSLKDGDAAAGLVSAATLRHYARLRDLALTADRATLGKEAIVDQLTVLSLRANVPVATLRAGGPREVVAAAVEGEVISGGGAGTTELADVEVDGGAASAALGVAGGSQEVRLGFRQEGGRWTVDLTALLAPAEESLKAAARREELAPAALLSQVMTQRVGAERARTLWEPPAR